MYSSSVYTVNTVHQYSEADHTGAQVIIMKTIWNANIPKRVSKNFLHFAMTIKNIFIFVLFW